jgi:hypothetical protein
MKYSIGNNGVEEPNLVFDMGSLYGWLGKLTDKRQRRGIRYWLADVLSLIVLAKLGGDAGDGRLATASV